MKLSDVKPAENHNEEKNRRGFWALDKSVRMVFYHRLSVFMVESKEKLMWHLGGGSSLLCYFLGILARCVSNSMMAYVISVVRRLCGNGKIHRFR